MAWMMALASSPIAEARATKLRSILMRLKLAFCSVPSAEYPVPKSSSAKLTPIAVSRASTSITAGFSARNRLSVISSSSRSGPIWWRASAAAITSGRLASSTCTADRLTDTFTCAGQRVAQASASLITQAPIGTIRPVSSATGTKSSGETTPSSG